MRPTSELTFGWIVALLLALPLSACGGAVQAEPGVSPRDAPKLLGPAICAKAYQCCTMSQLMNNDNAGTDMASCDTKTEMALMGQVSAIESSERKGRVNYDGLKVQACIDYLTDVNTQCSDLNMTFHLTGVPACSSFLEPEVALGGACTLDFECIEGFCDTTGVTGGGDGRCRALGKAGDSCANMGRCEPALVCDGTSMTCVDHPSSQPAPGTMCFYSSACSYAGGDRRAGTALGVALLLLAIAARRRRRSGEAAR
jgi:MYXO-CTERM domain-containing protein